MPFTWQVDLLQLYPTQNNIMRELSDVWECCRGSYGCYFQTGKVVYHDDLSFSCDTNASTLFWRATEWYMCLWKACFYHTVSVILKMFFEVSRYFLQDCLFLRTHVEFLLTTQSKKNLTASNKWKTTMLSYQRVIALQRLLW